MQESIKKRAYVVQRDNALPGKLVITSTNHDRKYEDWPEFITNSLRKHIAIGPYRTNYRIIADLQIYQFLTVQQKSGEAL